nr:Xaa-Pro peptidase family protein [Evansella caseinilytica]
MDRLQTLTEQFDKHDIDGMLITSNYNRRYITGFTGTAGAALVSRNGAKFITDFRYVEQAQAQAKGFEVVKHTGSIQEEINRQIQVLGIKKLGFEKDHVTYSAYDTYNHVFQTTLVPVGGLLEKLRLVKDPGELKIMKAAVAIADAAFAHIVNYIKPGIEEIAVSNELEFFMRAQGAVSSSFDIIVASGYRSALPHGVASNKVIEKGELVTLDFGAYYSGYCSDITRTVAVGEPSEELRKIYNTVLKAQLLGVAGIKPGMTGKEADALTRDHITAEGYGEYFGHSTGHGLGMEVHEGPGLSFKSDTVLQPGMVVTVEPGIYIAGVGGARIEDDVVITDTGNDILSQSPKDLIIID